MTLEEIKKLKRADLDQAHLELIEQLLKTAEARKLLEEENGRLVILVDNGKAEILELKDLVKSLRDSEVDLESFNELKATCESQEQLIRELNATVAKLDKVAKETRTTVEHDGKTFEVVLPQFKHNGEVYQAADLQNLPEVVEELIEIKSGALKLVTD
jgi:uncharacterized coiled-coil protein SlyX